MIAEAVAPRASVLSHATPSLWEDLRVCMYRVAFRRDNRFSHLRRLTPRAALGLVAHAMIEMRRRGGMVGWTKADVEREWDRLMEENSGHLRRSRLLGEPPPVNRWPGYQVTRVRLLRRLLDPGTNQYSSGSPSDHGSSLTEIDLQAPGVPLRGRIDRVELAGSRVEIVDLKSRWTAGDDIQPAHRRQLLLYACLWRASEGSWPQRASIEGIDGRKVTFDVDPQEAEQELRQLENGLDEYNRAAAAGTPFRQYAAPAEENCRRCDYRAACYPFFLSLNDGWGWYRRSVLGQVLSVDDFGTSVAAKLEVLGSNLSLQGPTCRVVAIPRQLAPAVSSTLSFVDGLPTPDGSSLRATWDSTLLCWETLMQAEDDSPGCSDPAREA